MKDKELLNESTVLAEERENFIWNIWKAAQETHFYTILIGTKTVDLDWEVVESVVLMNMRKWSDAELIKQARVLGVKDKWYMDKEG